MEDSLVPYLDTCTLAKYGCTSKYNRERCGPVVRHRRRLFCLRMALLRYRYLEMFKDTIPFVTPVQFWRAKRVVLQTWSVLRVYHNVIEEYEPLVFGRGMQAVCQIYGDIRKKKLNELFFLCI